MLLVACLVAAAPAVGAPRAAPFTAILRTPKTDPKVNVKWFYSITVRDSRGRLLSATVTAKLVDPFGGVHPIDYGPTQKPITNFRFKGVFRDYLIFPPESKGFRLTVRWTVKAKGATKLLTRKVTPRR